MGRFASAADVAAANAEMTWPQRGLPATLRGFLAQAAERHGDRPALSFQLLAHPGAPAETWSWAELHARATQAANLFRSLGVGEGEVVAFLLPNCLETVAALLGGAMAGVVAPINPLLPPEHVASLLRETGARVVVSLRAFPRTDLAQRTAAALALAPQVEVLLEVDLARYLSPPKSWLARLLRPRLRPRHRARVLSFAREAARQPRQPAFPDAAGDRLAALFHTGGTTGRPKVARHRYSGMIYNGWVGHWAVFGREDVLICPLPMFHVFAAYPVLMSAIASGAHVVMPTPAGYRGDGVMDNFWKLIERWKVTFLITVPTALSALMQRPVDADVSSLRTAISGSAPLPVELYQRFAAATGVEVSEGYGLTEATCLVSCNPVDGPKKVGSVGLPFPYSAVRIVSVAADGSLQDQPPGQAGEICLRSPGVAADTYLEPALNAAAHLPGGWLRTGDLGRIDADGYLWITGRAKDLIIRGGHNIDPAVIEEALMAHPAVAFAGAIGQPDAHSGEVPCAYVELVAGASASRGELLAFAIARIGERAARPKYLEILPELPRTAVGKVQKTELRKLAIARVFDAALQAAGVPATVAAVVEDPRQGLVARLALRPVGEAGEAAAGRNPGEPAVLGDAAPDRGATESVTGPTLTPAAGSNAALDAPASPPTAATALAAFTVPWTWDEPAPP